MFDDPYKQGLQALERGDPAAAVRLFEQAVQRKASPQSWAMLGRALTMVGRLNEAVEANRSALPVATGPAVALAHFNLANSLARASRLDEAVEHYQRAASLKPDFVEAFDNLGCALAEQGKHQQAIDSFKRSIALRSPSSSSLANLGSSLRAVGDLDAAILALQRAVRLDPRNADAWSNLGSAHREVAQLDEALAAYRRALALRPQAADVHSNLVYTLWFHPGMTPQAILAEHQAWSKQHAAQWLPAAAEHDRDPDRPLRIGYLSPDFRAHIVGLLIEPVLEHHDRSQFHITCYANVAQPDEATARMKCRADQWRDVAALTDEQLAAQIRDDRIDILVDLALHMARNRLLAIAGRPAPVQVCHLGYPATTGLNAIDYAISDPCLDPPGESESRYTEQIARLPHTYWCYRPPPNSPEPNDLPARTTGHITFGAFNAFYKINPPLIRLWARILQQVPNSRLSVLAPRSDSIARLFEANGIPRDRLILVPRQPRDRYLALYHDIDITLDTFPYNGHTTGIDSLWMGVPIVTLTGQTSVSRAGASLLNNVNLPDLITHTPDAYVAKAVALANDHQRLAQLRKDLRPNLAASPIMDEVRYTRDLEQLYRMIWRQRAEGNRG